MTDYTLVIDDYAQGRLMHLSMTAIIDQRNGTQHALMSLPSASTYIPDPRISEPLYEACRLAAIIYSIIVIFPFPACTAPFPELVTLLKKELESESVRRDWQRAGELILWILFMGGIASLGLGERRWYVEAVAGLAGRMGIINYDGAREILQNFLWLGSTSEGDALRIWSEVLTYQRERGLI